MSNSTANSLNPPQSIINSTFGPLVAGLMIQQFFVGIITAQAGYYYSRFTQRDSKFYLWLVAVLLVFNALDAATDFHILYRSAVTHYGIYCFFDLQTWTMWAEPAITAVVRCLAQMFFMECCWKVTHKSRLVFAVLTCLLLFSLGSGLAVSVSFFQVKLFSKLAKIPIPITLWLSSTAVTDITIACILCISLARSKPPFQNTRTVITRLIKLTVETSAVTALVAFLNLIVYFALPGTAYHLYPQFSMCRIYMITVLTTLLERNQLRQALDGQTYSTSFALTGVSIGPHSQDGIVNGVDLKVKTVVERDDVPGGSINGPQQKGSSTGSVVAWADAV
ncbi:hypothetical protein DFH09DRAFT_1495363 [Mycena vulgaris]|nr:hypothetical protein DFH09DRAFT_1495363 [Mycena vulgaris]